MTTKITYLLGAGASANAVPVVKDLSHLIDEVIKYFEFQQTNNDAKSNSNNLNYRIRESREFVNDLIHSFKSLSVNNKKFGTIDTYAKYLYLQNNKKEYKDLKKYLSIYFILHQTLIFNKLDEKYSYKEFDQRYLTFLISVMSESTFPENIKLLSWNYDFQFQLTSYLFREEKYEYQHLTNGKSTTKIPPIIDYWPSQGKKCGNINLYHINGIAGFFELSKDNDYVSIIQQLKADNCDVFKILKSYFDAGEPILNFAWERNELFKDISLNNLKDDLINHIRESEIMVIIGYSFPFFNRNVDKQIFDCFTNDYNSTKNSRNYKKAIYYQNFEDRSNNLYNQFGIPKNLSINFVDANKEPNFFIPYQY